MNMQWKVLVIMVHSLVCGHLEFGQQCRRNAEHLRIAAWQLNHKWIWWKKCFLFLPRVYLPPPIIAALLGFKQFIVFFSHHNSSSNTLLALDQNDGFYWNNHHIYMSVHTGLYVVDQHVYPWQMLIKQNQKNVSLVKCFKGRFKRVELSAQVTSSLRGRVSFISEMYLK